MAAGRFGTEVAEEARSGTAQREGSSRVWVGEGCTNREGVR